MEQRLARTKTSVTQIFNLLYRRLGVGRVQDTSKPAELSNPPQIANLQYGRVQLCATLSRFFSDFVIRVSSFPRNALGLPDHPLQFLRPRIRAIDFRHAA